MTVIRQAHSHVSKAAFIAALTLIAAATPHAQAPVPHRQITYIMPIVAGGLGQAVVDEMRSRIGEGPYVKVGFSAYINIEMTDWNVDITSPVLVRQALASTFARIDDQIATAQAVGIPVNLNVVTAGRSLYDPVQTASENEDRRSMQWYSTNLIAPGWWSHSRYARKARAVQEAYVREVGRYLARKMAEFPTVLVSAAGDGEVELSYEHSYPWDSTPFENPIIADYSPFAVAEFRDWLSNGGLYTVPKGNVPGGPYGGEGYSLAARYDGDATPGTDSNGDGHTLNGDFGTAFADWELRYANWSLTDLVTPDPKAIPLSAPPVTDRGATHFDAPRVTFNNAIPQDAWYQVWSLFRQTMLEHHNTDFAKWITTTPVDPALPADPATNPTVPTDRWYSYQIAADYLTGNSPTNYNVRFITSASAWTTADVSPHGGLGMTAFNVNLGTGPDPNGPYGKTLETVLPHVKTRNLRWALLEWHPSIVKSSKRQVYDDEMALVRNYRPGLLVPFIWDDPAGAYGGQVKDTGFEYALHDLVVGTPGVVGIRDIPVPYNCQFGVTRVAGFVAAGGTGNIGVTASAADCAWTATSNASWLTITSGAGTGHGTAGYSVAANLTITPRTGTITVNGVVHTVTQLAGTCTYALSAPSASSGYAASTGTVNVLAPDGCAWTAASNASFLTVTAGATGNGNGTVGFSVAAHRKHPVRTGTLTIAGQTFTVTQTGIGTPSDFTGDGHADLAVFSPGPGNWSIQGRAVQQFGLPGDVPVPGDYDGDTIEDVAVYRPVTGQWFISGQTTAQPAHSAGDIPVPADYNGDGKTDAAVYRYAPFNPFGLSTNFVFPSGVLPPSFGGFMSLGTNGDTPVPADYDGDGKADPAIFRSGLWIFRNSTSNYTSSALTFGVAGDVPVPRDYDGDGKADVAVYRPSTGQWFMVLTASNTAVVYAWGLAGDQPVPQDVDGDGADEIVVFRPSDGEWRIFNRVTVSETFATLGATGDIPAAQRPRLPTVVTTDADGDGRADMTVFRPFDGMWYTRLSSGGLDTARGIQWGLTGDVPVPGDYDGDRMADVAVYRPAGGLWYIRYSATGFATTLTLQWGLAGDIPCPADYDADGRTDVAVFRPSSGEWFVRLSSTQYATFTVTQFGLAGDVPLPADYDGDGRADLAVYRPATQEWYLKRSSTGLASVRHIGEPGDVPMAADFNGDGRTDFGVFKPSIGRWLAYDPGSVDNGLMAVRAVAFWGLPGDIPVPLDFDGDGIADIAVYRPSTGEWFVLLSPSAAIYRQWGLPGDMPLLTPAGGGSDR